MVKAVVADTTTDGKRTTLSPSLKMMAAERETTIAAIIIYKEKPTIRQWAGIFLAVLGSALVTL